MAITCWYCGTAFIALLQACRIEQLRREAEEGLDVLTHAVTQLQKMWATANIFRQGFDRLRKTCSAAVAVAVVNSDTAGPSLSATGDPHQPLYGNDSAGDAVRFQSEPIDGAAGADDLDWVALFPFVTRSTSRIAECLLAEGEQRVAGRTFPSPNNEPCYESLLNDFQDLIEPFNDYSLDFLELAF
jgi:hypothetical protein